MQIPDYATIGNSKIGFQSFAGFPRIQKPQIALVFVFSTLPRIGGAIQVADRATAYRGSVASCKIRRIQSIVLLVAVFGLKEPTHEPNAKGMVQLAGRNAFGNLLQRTTRPAKRVGESTKPYTDGIPATGEMVR